jgi:ribosomal protein L19
MLNKIKGFKFSTLLKQKKTNPFWQTGFNPYHIYPRRSNIKTEHDILLDDNFKLTKIVSPCKEPGKCLISLLQKEEMNKIIGQGIKKEKVSTGDRIEVEYYQSITSGKLNKYKGVVIGTQNKNSLTYSFKFLTQVAGHYLILNYPFYSPVLASVKVIEKTNFIKSKIHHLKKINEFGLRLSEVIKGGKKVNINKKASQNLRNLERQKEPIVIE